jgi:NTP pyrophosphatase (non-canonical NTP hydrolase)
MTYQEWSNHVAGFANSELTSNELLSNFALGLVCEAGEAGDVIKKHLFHGDPLDRKKLIKELGDVAWYWTALCQLLAIEPVDVLQANIDKLRARHQGTSFDGEAQRQSKAVESALAKQSPEFIATMLGVRI